MRKTCLDMIYELAKKDSRVVFIGSDLGVDVLKQFREEIPERFFMEGVSEANVVGMAAGLALEGKIPYVNTIATFLTRRCYEQVVLDLCLHKANVRLIGNGGGFVYAPLGPTHLAIEDIAIMRTIPQMTVVAPSDAEEMRRLMLQTVDYSGPMYIRLGKGYDPIVSRDELGFEIGKAIPIRTGKDVLIVCTGVALQVVLDATDELADLGIEATVLHVHTVKPLDIEAILQYATNVSAIVTVEEHAIIGGLGSAVAEVLCEADLHGTRPFRRIGIPDMFADEYGSQKSLMARFGLSAGEVSGVVNQLLGRVDTTN